MQSGIFLRLLSRYMVPHVVRPLNATQSVEHSSLTLCRVSWLSHQREHTELYSSEVQIMFVYQLTSMYSFTFPNKGCLRQNTATFSFLGDKINNIPTSFNFIRSNSYKSIERQKGLLCKYLRSLICLTPASFSQIRLSNRLSFFEIMRCSLFNNVSNNAVHILRDCCLFYF